MFYDEYNAVANSAKGKLDLLNNNSAGYFFASMLAGIFVGLGVLVTFTVGGILSNEVYGKIIMGASFTVALSLVVMAGSELFTGNVFVCTAGIMKKTISIGEGIKILIASYFGNWAGALLLAVLFYFSGLATGSVGKFMASSSFAKMSIPFVQLIIRGALCNMLVCLGVWCSARCKSESGKLIMFFWCIFTFVVAGFEHCVANMTLLTISLLAPFQSSVSIAGYFYNILTATIGNLLGGIFLVGLPYYMISKNKN